VFINLACVSAFETIGALEFPTALFTHHGPSVNQFLTALLTDLPNIPVYAIACFSLPKREVHPIYYEALYHERNVRFDRARETIVRADKVEMSVFIIVRGQIGSRRPPRCRRREINRSALSIICQFVFMVIPVAPCCSSLFAAYYGHCKRSSSPSRNALRWNFTTCSKTNVPSEIAPLLKKYNSFHGATGYTLERLKV